MKGAELHQLPGPNQYRLISPVNLLIAPQISCPLDEPDLRWCDKKPGSRLCYTHIYIDMKVVYLCITGDRDIILHAIQYIIMHFCIYCIYFSLSLSVCVYVCIYRERCNITSHLLQCLDKKHLDLTQVKKS